MKNNTRRFGAIVVVGLALMTPIRMALADSENKAFTESESFKQLSAEWWQWALSIPTSENPLLYAFDLLRLNGKDLRDLPIEKRKAKLEELLKKPPGVIRYSASFTKDIPELLDRTHKLGLEGLIGKRSGSRYESRKRSGAWIKIELHLEQEFVVGGYTEPEGSRRYFGALLVSA